MRWMIKDTLHREEENWIAQEILQGHNIMIVSDRSYHPKYESGTAAWVITSASNTKRRLYSNNVVPGEKYLQCSHRSELCGIIGAVRHITNIYTKYNIQKGKVELACDGLEACKIASRFTWKHTTTIGHFDMVSCLHEILKQSPLSWNFRHVKGHQDDITTIANIDIWGQLNMIADIHAKMALWRHIGNNEEQITIQQVSQAIPSLRTNYGGKPVNIASNLRMQLKHHIAQERILRF